MSRPLDNHYGAPTLRAAPRCAAPPRAFFCACARAVADSLRRADATYQGAPQPARKDAQAGITTKTVLNYDNMFSDVATHPRTSTIATKCVAQRLWSGPDRP